MPKTPLLAQRISDLYYRPTEREIAEDIAGEFMKLQRYLLEKFPELDERKLSDDIEQFYYDNISPAPERPKES